MFKGIRRSGDRARLSIKDERQYTTPKSEIAVFYGLSGNLRRIWKDHQKDGRKAVYIDLGYWGRRDGGRLAGYHKFAINGRHPTAYFQKHEHTEDRFRRFGLKVQGYQRKGDAILLAGMSTKAAQFEGFKYLEWETDAIRQIREVSDRPIIYRPKPGKSHGTDKIVGTIHSPREQRLQEGVLPGCFATVTHHSNVSVDGLILGVPAFCVEGVALPMSLNDLSKIEKPIYPAGREQWLNDIAWTQFTVREMEMGLPWHHLMNEGLLE